MPTYSVPLPLYSGVLIQTGGTLFLRAGPNLYFLPLFTSVEYADDFAKRAGFHCRVAAIRKKGELIDFISNPPMSTGIPSFHVIIDPVGPVIEDFQAFPQKDFLSTLKADSPE